MGNIIRKDTNNRMSQIVIHNDTMYLAGQVGSVETKDVSTQTSEVLNKIDNLLKNAGSDKTKILSAIIYLSNISDFNKMNKVWDNWLPENCAPARATIEAKLILPKLLVEISIIATR